MVAQHITHRLTSKACLTLLPGLIAMGLLAGCGNNNDENNTTANNNTANNTAANNTTANNTAANNTAANNTAVNNTAANNTAVNNTAANNTAANNTAANNTSQNMNPMGTASVQVLHLADGAGTVDIYANDTLLIDDLDEKAGTNFFPVPAGVSLKLDVVAGDATDNSAPVETVTLDTGLPENSTYIVAATGDATAAEGDDAAFRLVAIPGAKSSHDDAGTVSVMVIHGVDDAPTVDVALDNATTLGADPTIPALEFAGYTNTGGEAAYLDIDPTATLIPGVALIDINVAGGPFVAGFQAGLTGLEGQAAVIAATGSLEDGTFGLTAFLAIEGETPSTSAGLDLPAAARLQVVHNSADPAAASVDVYAAGVLLLDDFAFRTASPYLTVPSGTEIPVVVAAPDSTDDSAPVAGPVNVELDPGTTTIAVASGVVGAEGDAAFALLTTEGLEANAGEDIEVKIHHGSPDTPAVGVRADGAEANIIDSFVYGDFVGYVPLPTSTNTILEVINPAADDVTVVETAAAIDFSMFSTPVFVAASGSSNLDADGADVLPDEAAAIALIAVLPDGTVVTVPLQAEPL